MVVKYVLKLWAFGNLKLLLEFLRLFLLIHFSKHFPSMDAKNLFCCLFNFVVNFLFIHFWSFFFLLFHFLFLNLYDALLKSCEISFIQKMCSFNFLQSKTSDIRGFIFWSSFDKSFCFIRSIYQSYIFENVRSYASFMRSIN